MFFSNQKTRLAGCFDVSARL